MALRLMAVVLVVVIVAMFLRRRRAGRGLSAALNAPGASPETALELSGYSAIDEHVLDLTCACGGGFRPLGEGSMRVDGRELRVARLECGRCEAERLMYFVEPPLLH